MMNLSPKVASIDDYVSYGMLRSFQFVFALSTQDLASDVMNRAIDTFLSLVFEVKW